MAQEMAPTPVAGGGGSNNRTIIIIVIIVVVVLAVLGMIGRYVWSSVAQRATQEIGEELVEQAIEESSGGEANVELGEGTWPSDIPSEMQYSGSSVQATSSFENQGQTSTTVSLQTDADVSTAYEYYTGLANKGWEVSYKFQSTRSDTSKSASVSMSKADLTVAVSITEQEDEGITAIGITAITEVE